VADKKFVHVTCVIEAQVLKDMETELAFSVMCQQAGGTRDAFIKKLVTTVSEPDWDKEPIRFDYKDNTRGQ